MSHKHTVDDGGHEPARAVWWAVPVPREGWNAPKPEKLPRRTPWPVATALGTVLLFWGVVTSYLIFATGVGLLALSVAGWVNEIRLEGTEHE
jgi:hypothetical protein